MRVWIPSQCVKNHTKKVSFFVPFSTTVLSSHTIRKVKFLSKNSILTKPQHFHQIFFWQFFSWNQSCQQLKSPKPQHFHEFFIQKNRQFSRKIKVEFLDKKWRFRTVCSSRDICKGFASWKDEGRDPKNKFSNRTRIKKIKPSV